jgi:hypothetical protein
MEVLGHIFMTLVRFFQANLAAFLTVERQITPIENAEDLAKQKGEQKFYCIYVKNSAKKLKFSAF